MEVIEFIQKALDFTEEYGDKKLVLGYLESNLTLKDLDIENDEIDKYFEDFVEGEDPHNIDADVYDLYDIFLDENEIPKKFHAIDLYIRENKLEIDMIEKFIKTISKEKILDVNIHYVHHFSIR